MDPAIAGVGDPLPEALFDEVPISKFTVASKIYRLKW